MGLFDRFKKKKSPAPEPVEASTAAKLLFSGTSIDTGALSAAVAREFGEGALGEVSQDHPAVTSFLVRADGLEFWCAHMALPLPPEEGDVPSLLNSSNFLTPEEAEAAASHKSFLLAAQKGGGTSLAEKRRVCLLFTRLCGALMELEGAAAYFNADAHLLVGRSFFLHHAEILRKNAQDPDYFPAPLWVALSRGNNQGHTAIGTDGLRQFGFPELFFLDPKEDWPQVCEKLYLMSIFQITGKEVYRDGESIAFDPEHPAVFRQLRDRLAIIGG